MQTENSNLKRPWLLTLLALSFGVAPFANLITALYIGGHATWYSPLVWAQLFLKYSLFEQFAFLAGILVSILLFRQSKRSWSLAFVLVATITIYNLLLSPASHSLSFQALSFFNISATLSLLGILYFFRYPYLDKRDSIVGGTAPRFASEIPVKIDSNLNATVRNISKSGCFFLCAGFEKFQKGQKVQIEFKGGQKISAEVIHTRLGVGVKFIFSSKAESKFIDGQVEALSQAQIS